MNGILLGCRRILATFAAVNEPWTHHVSSNWVQRHPLVASGAEGAMGLYFATVGLALKELEPLLIVLAMPL